MRSDRPAASPSRTQEITEEAPQQAEIERRSRLVGSPEAENQRPRRVQWTEDTIDNENMNSKKSKICCIFHPNKEFDESSEEEEDYSSSSSSSSSSSESDSDSDTGNHGPKCDHKHKKHRIRRNAYERKPKTMR